MFATFQACRRRFPFLLDMHLGENACFVSCLICCQYFVNILWLCVVCWGFVLSVGALYSLLKCPHPNLSPPGSKNQMVFLCKLSICWGVGSTPCFVGEPMCTFSIQTCVLDSDMCLQLPHGCVTEQWKITSLKKGLYSEKIIVRMKKRFFKKVFIWYVEVNIE